MTKRQIALLIAAATTLPGCFPSPQETREVDNAACLAYGFQPGTVEMAQCMQQQDHQRSADYRSGNYSGLQLILKHEADKEKYKQILRQQADSALKK